VTQALVDCGADGSFCFYPPNEGNQVFPNDDGTASAENETSFLYDKPPCSRPADRKAAYAFPVPDPFTVSCPYGYTNALKNILNVR
jgi:hypothetical protein